MQGVDWNVPLLFRAALPIVMAVLWLADRPLPAQSIGSAMPGGGPSAHRFTEDSPELGFRERVREAGGPRYGSSGSRKLVVDVVVTGNETVKESKIRSYLRTRKDREFDSEVVQADVRRLLTTGLIRDVRTYTQDAPGGVIVKFEVFEQPTIRRVQFIGNRSFTDRSLEKQADLKVGDPMNSYAVKEARRKVEEFYRTKGYPQASVSILEGDRPQDRGVTLLISEGELQRISGVHFVGNRFVSASRLKTIIQSKRGILWYLGGKVDRRKIDEDVERLTAYYRNFGFFSARVGRELDFDRSGRWLSLTFVIDEGPRYVVDRIVMEGNQRVSSAELMKQLELKEGDYFEAGKMKRDEHALRDVYGADGRIFAKVEGGVLFSEEPGRLELRYKIEEGDQFRVGQINVHIAGDYPHTRQSVVMNRISVRPGDVIDIREVRRSERLLKASQLFENDPARGLEPRIVIRPPELPEIERWTENSSSSGGGSFRGQSPEGEEAGSSRSTAPRGSSSFSGW